MWQLKLFALSLWFGYGQNPRRDRVWESVEKAELHICLLSALTCWWLPNFLFVLSQRRQKRELWLWGGVGTPCNMTHCYTMPWKRHVLTALEYIQQFFSKQYERINIQPELNLLSPGQFWQGHHAKMHQAACVTMSQNHDVISADQGWIATGTFGDKGKLVPAMQWYFTGLHWHLGRSFINIHLTIHGKNEPLGETSQILFSWNFFNENSTKNKQRLGHFLKPKIEIFKLLKCWEITWFDILTWHLQNSCKYTTSHKIWQLFKIVTIFNFHYYKFYFELVFCRCYLRTCILAYKSEQITGINRTFPLSFSFSEFLWGTECWPKKWTWLFLRPIFSNHNYAEISKQLTAEKQT